MHAALADPARLLITDTLSEGDRRRSYLRLVPGALGSLAGTRQRAARRVLFVCTANSARSHLAAALWRQASQVPVTSAGTRPATAIDPGAVDAARRHQLPLPRLRPRHINGTQQDGDLVITVCDLAHEELGPLAALHWPVPDPVRSGDPAGFDPACFDPACFDPACFDAALDELSLRVGQLAPRLAEAPGPGR